MTLTDFFRKNPRVALAFSGGTDSAYLLYAALSCGADVRPYYVKTAFQPTFELEDANKLCQQLHVTLTVVTVDILSDETVVSNPADRCYHCKQHMFQALQQRALADGYSVLIDGTNASDDATDRPGIRALAELSVCSPLRQCGLTKSEIRSLSREAGLFTWNKPAYACLATRVPAGRQLSGDILHRIEQAENALFTLGYSDFRVRVFDEAACLQVPGHMLAKVAHDASVIRELLSPYFPKVFLDLKER